VDSLKRRNPPKTSNSEKFNAEILHSPYRGGEVEWRFRREATPDQFGLAQPMKDATK
jgi:hypothetical protein